MFRTQGGDFSFPYPIKGSDQEKAKQYARELFFNNKWPKQIHPLSWLVEKFWPVKGWSEEDLKKLKSNTFKFSEVKEEIKSEEVEPNDALPKSGIIYSATPIKIKPSEKKPTKGIVYYTDNKLKVKIAHEVQKQLEKISMEKNIPIVSVSLKPMPHFGDRNIHLPLERGHLAMFKQILTGIEASDADIVYLCEADVLYSPSHFDFTPPKNDKYYYNINFWKLRSEDGHAVHFDACQTSGLSANRKLLLAEYERRVKIVEKEGYKQGMGFEPGTHEKNFETYKSPVPIIDIRHDGNLTKSRWSQSEFRNKNSCLGWIETDDEIPGWGKTKDLIKKLN
jgi:hypothetical protein